jgi:Domain of Unknown Function (DUF928)
MHRQNQLGLGTLAITFCVQILMIVVSVVEAQAITFPPTQPRGAPARTVGGGQRGSSSSCANSSLSLTALTPNNNVVTTVTANPTLFWYVPKTEAKSAEFVVLDSSWNEVYKTNVEIKGIPGIVKLKIPTNVALETGRKYLWKFSLICDPENQSEERFVAGYIERTELNVEAKKAIATTTEPLKKVEVYANAMIWQETLSMLAQLVSEHPNDPGVTNAWRDVLASVELESIASQPLVECCTVVPPLQ